MAFDAHVYSLKLVNGKVYVLEDVCQFSFPTNCSQIRTEMVKLVDKLQTIENMVSEIKSLLHYTAQTDNTDAMTRAEGDEKNKNKLDWITDVYITKDFDQYAPPEHDGIMEDSGDEPSEEEENCENFVTEENDDTEENGGTEEHDEGDN